MQNVARKRDCGKCVKRSLSKNARPINRNAGQKYCRMLQGEHSAILIKLPFVIRIYSDWPLKTGFTVITSAVELSKNKQNIYAFNISSSLQRYHWPVCRSAFGLKGFSRDAYMYVAHQ